MKRLGAALGWLLALGLLHVVSLSPLPWTSIDPVRELWRPSPDAVALLAVAVLGAVSGRSRWFAHLAALLLLAAVLHATATVYVRLLMERELDLTFDLMHLPGLVHLWSQDGSVAPWMVVAGALLALLLGQCVLAWLFARVARPAQSTRGAVLLVVCLQALVLVDVARRSWDRHAVSSWRHSTVMALAHDVRQAAGYWLDPEATDGPIRARLAIAAKVMAAAPGDLERLDRADVHLVVVESYGRHALREPQLAARLRELWQQVGPELQAAGFEVCSAACRPANSGGGSWLSHAQLLSATRISRRREFQLLLASDVQPLPKRFQAAGYHTVEVMPAMPEHWPDGQRFYGFDEAITQHELDYRGVVYHWGLMPDQFALHHLLERVVRPAQQPLFTLYVSVTSHVPFRMVPPYIADWRIDATTFQAPPQTVHPVSWLDVPHGPALLPAFADTLVYALRTTAGFVARLPRPSLVIVLGDHQAPFAGVGPHADPSYDVPIHVLSNRPELIARCRQLGFVAGFDVPADIVAFDTAMFAPMLLQLCSR